MLRAWQDRFVLCCEEAVRCIGNIECRIPGTLRSLLLSLLWIPGTRVHHVVIILVVVWCRHSPRSILLHGCQRDQILAARSLDGCGEREVCTIRHCSSRYGEDGAVLCMEFTDLVRHCFQRSRKQHNSVMDTSVISSYQFHRPERGSAWHISPRCRTTSCL
jgi:hypothetical protein